MSKLSPGDLVLVAFDMNFNSFQYGEIKSIPFEDKPNIYNVQIEGEIFLLHEDLLTHIEKNSIVLTKEEADEIEFLGEQIDEMVDEIDELEQKISEIIEKGKKRRP